LLLASLRAYFWLPWKFSSTTDRSDVTITDDNYIVPAQGQFDRSSPRKLAEPRTMDRGSRQRPFSSGKSARVQSSSDINSAHKVSRFNAFPAFEKRGAVHDDIASTQARLEATDSRGLPELLDAAWDAFDLLITACRQCWDSPSELFAAFAFASAAAAEGRLRLVAAPSLPPTSGTATEHLNLVPDDLGKTASELAELAHALSTVLSSVADQAHDPADQAACADAARKADQVLVLLMPGP
jgi:hypothetical protein